MKKNRATDEFAALHRSRDTPSDGGDVRGRLRALMLEKMQTSPRAKGNENINTLNSSSRIPVLEKKSSDGKVSPVHNSKVFPKVNREATNSSDASSHRETTTQAPNGNTTPNPSTKKLFRSPSDPKKIPLQQNQQARAQRRLDTSVRRKRGTRDPSPIGRDAQQKLGHSSGKAPLLNLMKMLQSQRTTSKLSKGEKNRGGEPITGVRADGSTNQKPVRQTAQLEKHRNHQVAQEKSSKQQDQKVRRGEKVARDHQQPGARTEPEHDPSLEEQKRVKVKPLQEGDLSQEVRTECNMEDWAPLFSPKEHRMASVRDETEIGLGKEIERMTSIGGVNLICPLCHDIFQNPRLLPCLHTFCRRCLENLVVPRSNILTCPSCRTDIPLQLPSNHIDAHVAQQKNVYPLGYDETSLDNLPPTMEKGVGSFPPNFVVTTMMDVAAVRNSDQKPIMCSSCEDKLPAAARCIDCMDFLCYDCRNAHMRLRLTKSHKVVSLEELKTSSHPEDLLHRPIFCVEHSYEKLRYYCESCEEAICRECTMTTHSTSKHKYIQLTDTIDKQTNSIAQLVDKVRRKIPVVNQSAKDVEEVTCRLEARAEVAKSEIQKCFPRILKALQEREKCMFAEVENSVARKSKVLNNQQERLETELQKLQLTCTFTDQVLKHGNAVEILVVKKQLCDRLNHMISSKVQGEPEENDIIYFSANQDEVFRAIEQLGQIKTSNAFPGLCTVTDDMKRAQKGKRSKFTVMTRDHLGSPCSGGGEDVLADIYTSDGRTVPAEVEDKKNGSYTISYTPLNAGLHKLSVTVRDKHIQGSPFRVNVVNTGESYLKFGRKGSDTSEFNGIFGVAVDDDGRIIVTDCHNHRVQVFSSHGKFLFQFGRKGEGSGQFQCPTGVGVDPDGHIVVCERLGSRIQIFDRDGMFQQKFNVPDLKASTLAVDANRRIIVADSASRCIHVISLDTGQSFKFGSFGDGNGELNYPCYVGVNPQGHIIVSDMHSHRIQVFDSRGRFMFNFGRKGSQDGELMRPTGVAVSHEGNIIVADRDNHRIQIFRSDGRYLAKFGSKGDGEGQLNDPHGVSLTPEGNVVVADFRNNRVQLFGQPC